MAADPLTSATVEDLLNFDDTDDDDPFNDKPPRQTNRDDKTTLSPRGPSKRKASDFDDSLGLESEVKIKKQRKPIAKLDEARLLSAPGIPKLRADARMPNFLTKKLRIKGKGHEFSDVAKLLSYYQLWLDDLYPRAKFADGLQLVEKDGHSRRMQVMRKEWIDEGKPGYLREREARKKTEKEDRKSAELDDMYTGGDALMSGANNEALDTGAAVENDSLFVPDSRAKENADHDDGGLPEDDELDALLAEQEQPAATRPPSAPRRIVDDDSEGEDDLDALLAEQENRHPASAPSASASLPNLKSSSFSEDDDEDMDDLGALLAEQEQRSKPAFAEQESSRQPSTTRNKTPPTPKEDEFPIDEDDDLEALINEAEGRQALNSSALLVPLPSTRTSSNGFAAIDDPTESDGADMFSSSPVRCTAQSTLGTGGEHGLDSVLPSAHTATIFPEPTFNHVPTGVLEESTEQTLDFDGGDGDKLQATQTDKEEESQGMDADDMFSSSPVQNQ